VGSSKAKRKNLSSSKHKNDTPKKKKNVSNLYYCSITWCLSPLRTWCMLFQIQLSWTPHHSRRQPKDSSWTSWDNNNKKKLRHSGPFPVLELNTYNRYKRSQVASVYTETRFWAGWLRNQGLIPGRGQEILFSIASRPAMVPTELSMQWVQGAVSFGIKQQECQLTTHLHLVLRLRMVKLYHHFPICPQGIVHN
jgi:hypothetical protein